MNVLTRHVALEFLRVLRLCFISGVVIFVVIDVLERVDSFTDADASLRLTAMFFALRVPELVFELIPISMLVATAVSVGRMSQTNEITAMKAGGVSLYRALVLPLVVLGLCVSVLCMGVNEWLVPWSKQRSRQIMLGVKGKQGKLIYPEKVDHVWFHSRPEMVHVKAFYPDLNVLSEVTVYILDDNFRPVERLFAQTARWLDAEEAFVLDDVVRQNRLTGDEQVIAREVRTFQWSLEDIRLASSGKKGKVKDTRRTSQQMSFFALQEHIEKVEAAGYSTVPYRVDLYDKIAFPLVCTLIPILAIPFSLVSGRGGGLVRGLAISVVVGVSFYFIHSLMLSFGRVGRFSPVAAAFGADLLFLTVGGARLLRIPQ